MCKRREKNRRGKIRERERVCEHWSRREMRKQEGRGVQEKESEGW